MNQFMTVEEHREIRAAVLDRLATFTTDVQWIGGSADVAYASSVVELIQYIAEKKVGRPQ